MKIFPTALTVCLLAVQHVHSLDCYTTDLNALEARDIQADPIVKNCNEFLIEMLRRQGITQTVPFNEDDLRCFTAKIDTDRANIAIQGCTPQNSCERIVDDVKTRERQFHENDFYLNNVTCSECNGDLCNEGVTQSIFLKNWLQSERRKYLVITVVIIVLFMIVISTMLRVFSSKSRVVAGDPKYSILKV